MSASSRTARIVATLVLGLPSLAAIYGSAASLIDIAGEERLSDPRVLPFCLDILAIGIVVSAMFCKQDDRLTRATPWLAYGASAALQVGDVWADGPRAWAVHALPLAAAILGTEKIMRLWRPVAEAEHRLPVDNAPEPGPEASGHLPQSAEPGPPPPPEDVPATPAPAEVPPTPLRKPPARKAPARPAATSVEKLIDKAERLAARRNVAPGELSQRQLMTELHIGSAKAADVAAALKAHRPLELVSTNGAEP
jgi:hypothetical protein